MKGEHMRTKQELIDRCPRTVSELIDLDGQAFYEWQSQEIESGSYSFNRDRSDRFNRCYEASEDGADGSTHQEHIEDFRHYGEYVYGEIRRQAFRLDLSDEESAELDGAIDAAEDALVNDIDRCEEWHSKNGSLEQQVG